ncbi:MAG: protein kinase [Planctomycetes bacterium]|nr:protein kinase [Planctomycetota bacterium]
MRRIGRYEVIAELGRGGMGVVFKAWDPQAQAHVAIKLLLQSDPRTSKRFEREAQVLQRLQHPNVVPVRFYGFEGGHPYLVMDFVEGQTLEDRVEARGPLSVDRVAGLGIRLARALSAAHALGILHRDVKPANVLLRADGEVVLGDFGLAKDVALDMTQLTVEGGFMGTLGFVAPEQALGSTEKLGPPTDVYGLGATLYFALAGRPPVEGDTVIETLESLQHPPTPLTDLRPDVSPALASLVQRCLQPRVRERYRSCALVEQDLQRFLSGEVPAAPLRLDEGRRLPGWALGLGAVGALLAAAAVGLALRGGGAEGSAPPEATAPGKPDAFAEALSQAQAYAQVKDWEAARHAYERLLGERPEDPDVLHGLWEVLNELQDPRQIELLERAFAADPRPRVSLGWANNRHAYGDEEGAVRALRRGVEANPRDAQLLTTLGNFLAKLDRHAEAAEILARAWEVAPSYTVALNLSSSYSALGRLPEAARMADHAVELDPSSLPARYYQGALRAALGDLEGALEPLSWVWEQSGGDFLLAVRPLSQALSAAGRDEEALSVLDRGLRDTPQNLDLLFARSLTYSALGRGDEELADLNAILAYSPDATHALNNRMVALFAREDYLGSLADAERLVQLEPDSVEGWTQIGACQYALKEFAASRAAYARAIELAPERLDLRIGRGQAAQELEEYDAAIADYTIVLAEQPEQHTVRWHMGIAYDAAGKTEVALRVMRDMQAHAPEGSSERAIATVWVERLSAKLAKQREE